MTTKNELIAEIAEKTGKTKADVAAAAITTAHLKAGDEVVIVDIGRLKSVARPAREARSPATGAVIQVPAKNVLKFKPNKALADAVA